MAYSIMVSNKFKAPVPIRRREYVARDTKVTSKIVKTMRSDWNVKQCIRPTLSALADKYALSQSYVSMIVNNKVFVDAEYIPPSDTGRGGDLSRICDISSIQDELIEKHSMWIRCEPGGMSPKELSEHYEVPLSTVYRVIRRRK